ncbi:reverse transcriptase [Corchorus capsularis]|uniref:Reverse transcriptase n=1 Tax=Corchorus capsularis TaxID=210143 RepID=A0A1R3HRZ4_COCAP|nr:reverse transcriptase [Corchorus capsularis]
MKLTGWLKGHQVRILIDSGSTHNLIQPRLAKHLGLLLEPAPPFSVLVGNGEKLHCFGKIPTIAVELQGHQFDLDLYVLDVWGAEIILGVQWLATLGPVLADYQALFMQFYSNGQLITLRGDKPIQVSFASKKKDGTWRFCVDYRALNAATIKDRFPLPTVYELIDELHGAKVFSKLDLRAGYHQIRVASEDVHKTAFRTVDGHYEFLVMPFGLTNAPSTFQAIMNEVFRPYLRQFVLVFFDDILVYSSSMEVHLEHLSIVLNLLAHHHFYAKLSKCTFGQTSIDYLGHMIGEQGVHVDPSKISAVTAWPIPTNLKTLRGFLGLTGYYRKFVKNYAHITAPLTNLLRKDSFQWSDETEASFQALKNALTTAPVLALPDFSLPFSIEADASNVAIGAVLAQAGHPVAYYSKKLGPQKQLASTYVRELYAITEAIHKWRQYLIGRPFVIYTDQQSIRNMMNQTVQTPEQQKWLVKLLRFQYSIEYKPGHQNSAADALSRCHSLQATHLAITQLVLSFLEDLRKFYLATDEGKKLWAKGTSKADAGFTTMDGLLLFKGRIVKYETTRPGGLSTPLPIPTQIWPDIAMDFITNLPASHGKTDIWVIVDRLTKYAHFIALPSSYTASQLAEIFCKDVCKLHGMPASIVSDRDPKFMSNFWSELFKLQGTKLLHSSAYHPQSDGQSEVLNRCLQTYLRCFASEKPRLWTKFLHWAEYSYNTSFHTAAGLTPFEDVYGRSPLTVLSYLPGATKVAKLEESLVERQQILTLLKNNLERAQNRMKMQHDHHRTEKQFEVGDLVLLRLQPYRQIFVSKRSSQKLAKRFFGPFEVLRKLGPVAYELKLPPEAKIHPVFHVSLLKRYYGSSPVNHASLPSTFVEDKPVLEPMAVLDCRETVTNGITNKQFLVQ